MECKAGLYTGISADTAVLIETLWNVKLLDQVPGLHTTKVLIETLWNVKLRMQNIMIFSPDLVLIETLWNVKIRQPE